MFGEDEFQVCEDGHIEIYFRCEKCPMCDYIDRSDKAMQAVKEGLI
jgi:hypothetical protein